MNKTEIKAKLWLESQGFNDLLFQHTHSPDFITSQGKGFEIKKVREHTILFSTNQWEELKNYPDVTLLLFDDGDIPEAIVPFGSLTHPPSYWEKYRLIIRDLTKNRYKVEPIFFKMLRKQKHWSKSELARQLGVTYKTVRCWEAGECQPSPMALKLLKKVFDL